MKRIVFVLFSQKHILWKFLISFLIFVWTCSGQIGNNWKVQKIFAQETNLIEEATTSTVTTEFTVSIIDTGDGIISTINSASSSIVEPIITIIDAESGVISYSVDSAFPEIASTTTGEVSLSEESVKTQSVLANLFGAVFDLLFEKNDLSEAAEDKILREEVFGDIRAAVILRNKKTELWIGTLEKTNWQKIADQEMISENSSLGFQDNIIFWISSDQRAIVGLDILRQTYFSQSIEPIGNTVIEFNFQKYILLIQDARITFIPQIDETNESGF